MFDNGLCIWKGRHREASVDAKETVDGAISDLDLRVLFFVLSLIHLRERLGPSSFFRDEGHVSDSTCALESVSYARRRLRRVNPISRITCCLIRFMVRPSLSGHAETVVTKRNLLLPPDMIKDIEVMLCSLSFCSFSTVLGDTFDRWSCDVSYMVFRAAQSSPTQVCGVMPCLHACIVPRQTTYRIGSQLFFVLIVCPPE